MSPNTLMRMLISRPYPFVDENSKMKLYNLILQTDMLVVSLILVDNPAYKFISFITSGKFEREVMGNIVCDLEKCI
jgi:hypothetical protein